MNTLQRTEPRHLSLYMQQALRPISKRYYYSSYVDSIQVNKNDNILEIGSGIGIMAKLLAAKVPDGQLTCVDISERYLSIASRSLKSYSNTTMLNGNLSHLELETGIFDKANLHFVLHDVPAHHRRKMVDEIHSLLRPGGKVYIREPLKESHGIPSKEIDRLFLEAGFVPLYHREKRIRVLGNVSTACYAKISKMKFFLA